MRITTVEAAHATCDGDAEAAFIVSGLRKNPSRLMTTQLYVGFVAC